MTLTIGPYAEKILVRSSSVAEYGIFAINSVLVGSPAFGGALVQNHQGANSKEMSRHTPFTLFDTIKFLFLTLLVDPVFKLAGIRIPSW